ncbi:MAG TPA: GNAT family N-acetyltransferase, partial [Erysipelothrix sp.]|nr:GNAT family N-acetyltransferase [Erysipelothrix sp.]
MSTKLRMIYSEAKEINLKPLSSDYSIRFYQKGEADKWVNVVTQSGEFDTLSQAQERFNQEFKEAEALLESRCLFLEDKDKEVVGTIMMWDGVIQNKKAYRIHWLSITPKHQGKGLSKHLL